ncbi:MAG: C39 family peptidase [Chloroflexi bacterium]|nr:C39 family peptidase [Chloroflexota bacterium]
MNATSARRLALLVVFVCILAWPAPPVLAATPPGGSAIVGAVLVNEGGESKGSRPLAGASVRIAGPGLAASLGTGAHGVFSFGPLAPGAYTITVLVPSPFIPLSGTSRTIQVDGKGSYRSDFLFALPARPADVPTPIPTRPLPTPTPLPTLPPIAIVTPMPTAEPPSAPDAASAGPSARAAPSVPRRPLVTSLQGLRYAPGRTSPSQPQTTRTATMLWLGVPFVTQLDGTPYAAVNCGPASTAMVLGTFGIRLPAATIRDYVNYMSGVFSLDAGTSLDHLGRVVREAGLETHDLYDGGAYRRWDPALLREHLQSGHPIVTLVKYRALPGNGGSLADLDHYIVISGLSGNDFVYNDAAFTTDRGYGLLMSEGDLLRAWDYSSIPRYGMAVSLHSTAPPVDPVPDGADDVVAAQRDAGLELGEEIDLRLDVRDLILGRIDVDPDPSAQQASPEPPEGVQAPPTTAQPAARSRSGIAFLLGPTIGDPRGTDAPRATEQEGAETASPREAAAPSASENHDLADSAPPGLPESTGAVAIALLLGAVARGVSSRRGLAAAAVSPQRLAELTSGPPVEDAVAAEHD